LGLGCGRGSSQLDTIQRGQNANNSPAGTGSSAGEGDGDIAGEMLLSAASLET
jgi:hypothetical protein